MKRLAALCAAASLMLGLESSAALEPLRIGYTVWVGFGPLYLAHEKGFFEAEGVAVDLQVIDDPRLAFAALAGKRIDGYTTTPNTLLLNVKPESRFVMVMTADDSRGGDGIVARKEIKTIADLRGRRVALNEGSVAQFYLSYVLKRAGLSERDVTLVNMTTGDAGAAFVAGRVDAAVVWEPWLSRGKRAPHGHVLMDSSTTPGIIIDTLVFREDILKSRPDDVRKVVRAVFRAVDYWRANRKESVEIMARGLGGWLKDPGDFEQALGGAMLYDRELNRRYMGTRQAPGPMYRTVQDAIEFWRSGGKLVWPGVRPEDVIDPSFLE